MSDKTGTKGKLGDVLRKGSPILIFLVLFIVLSILSPNFLTWSTIMNILRQSAVLGILAVGQALVIMSGGIDLSVGAMMAFGGCVMAVANTQWGLPPVVCILLGILLAVLIGLLNGILTAKVGLFDFIATLGTQTAASGLALLTAGGLPISGMDESMTRLGGRAMSIGIPYSAFIFLLVLVVGWVLLEKTTFGRNVLAIGGNKEAARVSGIRVDRTKIMANVLSGVFAGIAGFVLIGRLNSGNALMGTNYELNSIAAVVIGGTSINGGEGSMIGTLIGVLTMGTLQCGMDLLGASSAWQKIILGVVIVGVVTMDNFRRKKVAQ